MNAVLFGVRAEAAVPFSRFGVVDGAWMEWVGLGALLVIEYRLIVMVLMCLLS